MTSGLGPATHLREDLIGLVRELTHSCTIASAAELVAVVLLVERELAHQLARRGWRGELAGCRRRSGQPGGAHQPPAASPPPPARSHKISLCGRAATGFWPVGRPGLVHGVGQADVRRARSARATRRLRLHVVKLVARIEEFIIMARMSCDVVIDSSAHGLQ